MVKWQITLLQLVFLLNWGLCQNSEKPIIMGHGGMGYSNFYPMDSEKSILKCLRTGCSGVEIDVQMTIDSVLVCYHDFHLDSKTRAKGVVNDYTYNEISGLKVKNNMLFAYPVLALDSLFSKIKTNKDFYFTFDCKLMPGKCEPETYFSTYINCLINIIEKYDLQNNVFIESQSEIFLNLLKKRLPGVQVFIYPANFEKGLEAGLKNGYSGITISLDKITSDQIKLAHEKGLKIAVWNVNTRKKNRDALKKNPDCIQTDRVKNLVKLLRK